MIKAITEQLLSLLHQCFFHSIVLTKFQQPFVAKQNLLLLFPRDRQIHHKEMLNHHNENENSDLRMDVLLVALHPLDKFDSWKILHLQIKIHENKMTI